MTKPAKDFAQEVQESTAENGQFTTDNPTKPNIAQLLERIAIIKMRIVAVRAAVDKGTGIETELQEIIAQLQTLKAQPTEATTLQEVILAMTAAEECAAAIHKIKSFDNLDYNDIEAAQEEIEANPAILEAVPEDARRSLLDDAGIRKLRDVLHSFTDEMAATWLQADIAEMVKQTVEAATETGKTLQQNFGQLFKALQEKATHAEKVITEFIKSNQFEDLCLLFADLAYWLDPNSPGTSLDVFWLADFCENIDDYMPFIVAEVEQEKKRRGVDSISFSEFIRDTDPESGESIKSLFEICIERAQEALAGAGTPPEKIPTVKIKRAELVEYPLDKINSTIWQLLEQDTGGQIQIKAEKNGSKKPLNILYSIDFEDLGQGVTITKRLMPFDKRVYIAISALFNAGNDRITLSQIYYAMGYTGTPAAKHLEKINDAITKMNGAKVYVNNKSEAASYNYPVFVYDGSLLPFERIQAIVNGQLTDAAIHLFREPPIITFAKQRKQVTTFEVALLQSPISKTDANLQIDDYLIERICKAQNRKNAHSEKILYATLYTHAGITTKKQKQRAPEKIKTYLDHYKSCGKIKHYTMAADGVTVYF